jgi:hypothetical protein
MNIDTSTSSSNGCLADLEPGDVFRYVCGPEDIISDDDWDEDHIMIVTDETTDDETERRLCVQLSNGTIWRLSTSTDVVSLPHATVRT